MKPTRIFAILFILFCSLVTSLSCTKTPFACFTVNGSYNVDTVQINRTVTFNAYCSLNTHDFNWQFFNNMDSIAFGQLITKSFTDTGQVNIFLFVTNGNDYTSVSQNIEVVF